MSECREIQTGHTVGGYGRITSGGKRQYLHRWVWEQINGPIPKGMVIMHRCDNPPCFRYDHLTIGTHTDNVRDMFAKRRNRGQFTKGHRGNPGPRTHCRRGHELTTDNVYVHPKDGVRECDTCRRERGRRRHQ